MLSWTRFATDILKTNFGTNQAPYRLFIVVTKSCQSRCRYCHIWKSTPENELTLSEFTELAKNSPWLKWLNLSGGEPTDRDDLPAIVAAFRKHAPDLLMANFTTNGLRPSHIVSQVEKISELRIPKFVVNVSIDGPPEIHDSIRGVPGNFGLAVETLRGIRKIPGAQSKVSYTLYPKNKHLIQETHLELKKRIPDFVAGDFHLNIPHQSPHFYLNDGIRVVADPELPEILREFYRSHPFSPDPLSIVEEIYRRKTGAFLNDGVTPLKCAALEASVYISEKGEIYPCTIWDKPLGSLRENGFDVLRILRDDRARRARKDVEQKKCPQCWTPCEAIPSILGDLPGALT